MDLKDIKSLIQFISKLDLPEVNIEVEGVKVHIKNNQPVFQSASNLIEAPASIPVGHKNISSATTAPSLKEESFEGKNYIAIKSPMIGTFYSKPSPEKSAFVKAGDQVEIGSKVCIIEAMKLFNEIESEVGGKIIKILVEDASPVEYDQPLFLVDPT